MWHDANEVIESFRKHLKYLRKSIVKIFIIIIFFSIFPHFEVSNQSIIFFYYSQEIQIGTSLSIPYIKTSG